MRIFLADSTMPTRKRVLRIPLVVVFTPSRIPLVAGRGRLVLGDPERISTSLCCRSDAVVQLRSITTSILKCRKSVLFRLVLNQKVILWRIIRLNHRFYCNHGIYRFGVGLMTKTRILIILLRALFIVLVDWFSWQCQWCWHRRTKLTSSATTFATAACICRPEKPHDWIHPQDVLNRALDYSTHWS